MRNVIILCIILIFMAVTIALTRTADHAVDAYATAQAQPPSAVDTILQSRQPPPLFVDSCSGGAGVHLVRIVTVVMTA